ncbi:hypothetical protein GCM10010912_51840 [Paenibacillus albidus]|uniref:Tissue inhibitor of metalloproteinase n=1 Tax=Paenibacillus albidus TaxID=2041023 RepID=A0A917FSX6_9BACL|nr:hypothetical protein [Paenibacillus albidus]GGG00620.1 hypothetical protein GCM10010912_51840 [Paenibacillus albidus]
MAIKNLFRSPLLIIMSVLLMATALLTVRPEVTYACSCVVPGAPLEELERSAAVFSGEVVSVEAKPSVVQSSGDPVTVTFNVQTIWKGEVGSTVTVTTAMSSASCGFEFTEGESYLVYSHKGEGSDGLKVSLCSRTTLLSGAAEDKEALGPGISPGSRATPAGTDNTGISKGTADDKGTPILLYAGLSLAAVLLIAVILRVVRQTNGRGKK